MFLVECVPLPVQGSTIDSLFSRLETDAKRKREEHGRKKFALVANVFCGHAYLNDLMGQSWKELSVKKKITLDWTNRHILEHMNREEKRQNCQFPV